MGRLKFWKKKQKVKQAKKTMPEMLAEVEEIREVVSRQVHQLRDQQNQNLQNLLESAEEMRRVTTKFEKTCKKITKKERAKARCCGMFSCCPTLYCIITCGCCPCCNETTTRVAMRNENVAINVIEVQNEDGREDFQSTNLTENIEGPKSSAGQTDKEIVVEISQPSQQKQHISRDIQCSSSQAQQNIKKKQEGVNVSKGEEASSQEKPQLKKKKKKLRLLKRKKPKQDQQHSSDVPCGSSHAHQKVEETHEEEENNPHTDVAASSKVQTPKLLQTVKEAPSSTPGTENIKKEEKDEDYQRKVEELCALDTKKSKGFGLFKAKTNKI